MEARSNIAERRSSMKLGPGGTMHYRTGLYLPYLKEPNLKIPITAKRNRLNCTTFANSGAEPVRPRHLRCIPCRLRSFHSRLNIPFHRTGGQRPRLDHRIEPHI